MRTAIGRFCVAFVLFALSFSGLASAGTKFQATTTLAAETGNNTSTADSFVAQSNGNIGATNISKVPVRNLLYAGSTTKIYTHFMPWFGFASHMNVGYASYDVAQVQKQLNDMVSRGLDGAIVDWYGPGEFNKEFTYYDQATQALMHQAELHPGFQFAIMYDAGALKTCAATAGCDLTQTVINDLNYAATTYEGSPAYMRFAGRPVIYFFGDSAYTIDWTRVRNGVANNPEFIFRNSGSFTHAQSNGGFSWLAPHTTASTDIASLGYLDNYYTTALNHSTMYSDGSAYKGFNDSLAAWGSNRFIDQQCGQTWLQSLAEAGKYYSSTRQMLGIQLVTWNDYEEASEIETGIDNCVAVSASVTGTVVNWSITGQQNTIDHFSIFVSQDGQNLMWLADTAASVRTMDIAQFKLDAGNYVIFVKAVGQPSMTNKMSAGVQLTVPNQPPVAALSVTPLTGDAPLTVTGSAAGSVDVDGTVVSTLLDFGDGSAAVSAISASHIYTVPGTYRVLLTVTDNLGATSSANATVVVTSPNKPPVAVLSLSSLSGIAPATITASTSGSSDPDGTIASSTIDFGDGSAAVSAASASHVYNTPGIYTVKATVTDNLGASSTTTAAVNIAANKPPIAALTLSAISGIAPASITASTAGSSDPDGTIASSTIDFGDGSLAVSAASASHVYNTPGTYTVRATVTDNLGASSSTTAAVNIAANKPPIAALTLSATSGIAPATLTASTSGSSDPDGTIASSTIDFGDGSVAVSAASSSHVYNTPGTFTVKATVTDNLGASSSTALLVTILANKPPLPALSLSASSGYGPLSVTASTAGSSDPDGSVASSTITFGDGSAAVSGPSASHTYSAAGVYAVTATVKDNLGATSTASGSVTVKAPEVVVSSPASGATGLASPIHVVASGFSGYSVTTMQVYLDGTLVYSLKAASVDTLVNARPGSHTLTVKAWDASGRSFMQSLSASVANQPPTAVLTTSATAILAGGSITASTANSTASSGSIAASTINFGDGSPAVNAASASHQYKTAGTYTITATVTDNLGLSSSASQSVTVKPRFVSISSPVNSSTTTNSSVLVTASAFSGYNVTATQVYIDGVLKYQTSASSLNASFTLGTGAHNITVKGWDAAGSFMSSVSVTRK